MKTIKSLPNTELLPNVVSQLTSERSSIIGDSFNVEKTLLSNSKGKLVLHFDINETILIGDKAGGDTVNDCLNKIIAKSAFVEFPQEGISPPSLMATKGFEPTNWWDGSDITKRIDSEKVLPVPLYTGFHWPPNSCPYYRTSFKKRSKTFTEGDGAMYISLYHKLKGCFLEFDEAHGLSPSHPFYIMIPSFFSTLAKLQELGKDYILVLRTFGSDLDDIASALKDFANGKHPHFPDFREPKLVLGERDMYRGRYGCTEGEDAVFNLFDWNNSSKIVASGDDAVLNIIESKSVCGIQDDYNYWDSNHNSPMCGKPIWIHPANDNSSLHHLFFDDNIHNDVNDSIVAVRARKCSSGHWTSLTGEDTVQQQGKYVVRVPTVAAILDEHWFLHKIALSQQLISRSS